jgi:hypothetical protein
VVSFAPERLIAVWVISCRDPSAEGIAHCWGRCRRNRMQPRPLEVEAPVVLMGHGASLWAKTIGQQRMTRRPPRKRGSSSRVPNVLVIQLMGGGPLRPT